jgi:polysaccharide export outer membrane protein
MMHVNTLISAIAAVLLGFQSAYGVASPQGSADIGAGAAIPAFGYDVFQSAAGPITEGPVDDQYLLSPGDEIVVSIWGELNETFNLTVTSEGFVELPEKAGRIATNGLTLRDFRVRVQQALSQIYASYINAVDPSKSTAFVDIRLGKLRPLLVYVVGEVNKPGAYGVSASVATVVNLLTNAGGVRPAGSLREIKIRRADGQIDVIDLYGFLLNGEVDERRMRLRPGDYVIVPLKRRAATVAGEVRRPMSYELVGQEGLREAIGFAGGPSPSASLRHVQVRTIDPARGQVVRDLDLGPMAADPKWNVPLADGDEVTVGRGSQRRSNTVTISGDGVNRPGTYEWTPGMRLSDAIAKAEGLQEHAFLDRADLIRTEDDYSKRLLTFELKGIFGRGEDGRIVKVGGGDADLPLREMDEVAIQSGWGLAGRDKSVTLEGHVKSPGAVTLAKGMTLHDLLFMRGGFQDPEFLNATYTRTGHLVRKVPGDIGRKLITFDLGRLLEGDPAANMPLEDGDAVRVFATGDLQGPRTARIDGLVQKPGTYPIAEGMTLDDLIVLAGGVHPTVARGEAVVARPIERGSGDQPEHRTSSTVVAVDTAGGTEAQSIVLRTDDRVTVRHQAGWEPLDVASIAGEVRFPGSYALARQGETLTQLVARAGGLRPEAYPDGALLRRQGAIVSMGDATAVAMEDVTIDLAAALKSPGTESDLILREGDQLFVPSATGTVTIAGAVRRPQTIQHRAAMKLSEYVAASGGMLDSADAGRITVTAPNNSSRLVAKGQDPVLAPGSAIDVPLARATERLRTVEVKGAVAQPAFVQFIEGARLGYYLGVCGGFSANADLDRISVLLPDGRVLRSTAGTPFDPEVPAGAVLIITAKAPAEPAVPAAP